MAGPPRRIGVVGHGAIGAVVAGRLAAGMEGLALAGVHADSAVSAEYQAGSFDELLASSDLIVEAASQEAVAAYGPATVEAGRDLLIVSVGALLDDVLLSKLSTGDGRLLITTGAIGGVDLLRAAAMLGELEDVSLVTRKPARALVRPWMDADLVDALEHGDESVTVFSGLARSAVERFPESVNVAATLSLVTIGFDAVRVEVVGDPGADHVEHTVGARGAAGSYEFTLRNVPSPDNIRTSAITPYSVLRGLADLDAHVVAGF